MFKTATRDIQSKIYHTSRHRKSREKGKADATKILIRIFRNLFLELLIWKLIKWRRSFDAVLVGRELSSYTYKWMSCHNCVNWRTSFWVSWHQILEILIRPSSCILQWGCFFFLRPPFFQKAAFFFPSIRLLQTLFVLVFWFRKDLFWSVGRQSSYPLLAIFLCY